MVYRYSLLKGLVQGGLENPREAAVTMTGSVVIHLFLTGHEKLLRELHIEPKKEETVGIFLSVAIEEGKDEKRQKCSSKKSNRRRKKWDQGTFVICCKTQNQKRMAPRKLLYLISLYNLLSENFANQAFCEIFLISREFNFANQGKLCISREFYFGNGQNRYIFFPFFLKKTIKIQHFISFINQILCSSHS